MNNLSNFGPFNNLRPHPPPPFFSSIFLKTALTVHDVLLADVHDGVQETYLHLREAVIVFAAENKEITSLSFNFLSFFAL